MKHKMSAATLVALGAFVLVALSGVLLLPSSDNAAHAQSSPSVAVSLSDTSVEQGAAITATMSFGGLTSDPDTSTTDYVFRADVVEADDCEGGGLGVDRNINRVDEDPEVRTRTIAANCSPGAYTLRVSISSAGNTELASASAGFFILGAPVVIEPPTLTALSVSHGDPAVDVALSPNFNSGTLEYSADVKAERVTVAPTAGDADATIAYLDGNGDAIADADLKADGHQVDLGAGSNTVKVAVTKDGLTTTYTLTLFRLETRAASTAGPGGLTSLTVSEGTLSPAFDPPTLQYGVDVEHHVTRITVTASPRPGDQVSFSKTDADTTADGFQMDLEVGNNSLDIVVSSSSPPTVISYRVLVTRATAATGATLSALTLSGAALKYTFAPGNTSYTADVDNSVSSTTVTATTSQTAASAVITPTDADSNTSGHQVNLDVGDTVITVEVTSEDGNTTKTYAATVTCAAPPCPGQYVSGKYVAAPTGCPRLTLLDLGNVRVEWDEVPGATGNQTRY